MDVRKIALLVGALIIAAVAAFAARSMFAGAGSPQVQAAAAPAEEGPMVLVATRALPVGTIIEADSFRFTPWPEDLVQAAYFLKGKADPATLTGTVVRYPVTAGQPITQGALVKPGDRGFLAAALGAGMRAVTISTDDRSGVAGFVFPGDRIDLMLTQTVEAKDEGTALKTSETFVRNLRVLATDQRTVVEDEEGKREVRTFQTVTLEVTPKIAEKLAVAREIGQLSVALRSIADNTAELEAAIASGAVKVPQGASPKEERAFLAAVAQRPNDVGSTYSTGADVSRFQRGSMPVVRTVKDGGAGTPSSAPAAAVVVRLGPVVRVARGTAVSEVQLGGK